VLKRVCLWGTALQSNRFLPSCRLAQLTFFFLSTTLIANRSAACIDDNQTTPSCRVLEHQQVGNTTPTYCLQGRSFPKTPWHIYNNSVGKRRALRHSLVVLSATRPPSQPTYITNEDSAKPRHHQQQRGSGRPRRPMTLQSRLSNSALL
jgi:hypothetical protein